MKLLSISLSPNVFPEDIEAAKKMLHNSSVWIKGEYLAKFTSAFADFFEVAEDRVYLFNAGRSALMAILQAFSIGEGDEVLLQAFTCNAVPNPVIWVGAKPVYVDVKKDTFNVDMADIVKKITKRTKVIIVQHTFGLAADMDKILEIAKKYNLFIIEDCAHALGATYQGKKVGTFGDAAFFSFGRDKVISSVYGGAAIMNLKSQRMLRHSFGMTNLKTIYNALPYPPALWVKQQLRHPIVMEKFLRWYNTPFNNYGIGKFLLQTAQVTRFFSKAVHWKEKQGEKPDYFPAKMPNALAYLALAQFKRLEEFNAHRRELAKFYYQNLQPIQDGHIYLRYPIRHPNAREIIQRARAKGILLGDWYTSPIAPDDTNLENVGYKKGSCPVAEQLARETFNLPTNPNLSIEDARRIVEFLKNLDLPKFQRV